MQLKSTDKVDIIFKNYPENIRPKMEILRALIIKTARTIDGLESLEETLKWGEPSYVTKHGSTLRINIKRSKPNQYAMYFQCTSKLVSTFRLVYKNMLNFEGNRAVVFNLENELPEEIVTQCIKAALTYHKVKHLPTLGI